MHNTPSWITRNFGRAKSAFLHAKNRIEPYRGSSMVRKAAPSLADGPKPPGSTGAAVKRQSFNQRWDAETRAASRVSTRSQSQGTKPGQSLASRKAQLKAAYLKSQKSQGMGR